MLSKPITIPESRRTSSEIEEETRKNKQAAEIIKTFINEFRAKFGISPRVTYSFDSTKLRISLEQLIAAIDDLILRDDAIKNKISIKERDRRREIVLYRQCGFRIAVQMGYGPSITAEAFGYNHATVIHSNKVIQSLIDTRNKQALTTLNNIENELKERFGNDRNVEFDSKNRDNP